MSWALGGLLANATGGVAQGMLTKHQWDRDDERLKLEKEAAERANRGLDLQERQYNEVTKPTADRAAELFPIQKEHQQMLLEAEKQFGIPAKKLEALSKFSGTMQSILTDYGVDKALAFYNENKGMFGDIGMPALTKESFKEMKDKLGWEVKLDDGHMIRFNKDGRTEVTELYEPASVKAAKIKAGADITVEKLKLKGGGGGTGKLSYTEVKNRMANLKTGISTSLTESKGLLSKYGKSGGGYEQSLAALDSDDASGASAALSLLMGDMESAYASAKKKAEKGDAEAAADMKRLQVLASRVTKYNDEIANLVDGIAGNGGGQEGSPTLIYVPGKGFQKPTK